MSQQLQLRGAPAATLASFVGAAKELLVGTDNDRIYVQDGSTAGGVPTAKFGEVGSIRLIARGVNLAALGDTSVPVVLPPGYSRYGVSGVIVANASAVPTSAKLGVYTAASEGGTPVNSPGQSSVTITTISANTSGNMATIPLAAAGLIAFNVATLFVNVGTVSSVAATADIIIKIDPLS